MMNVFQNFRQRLLRNYTQTYTLAGVLFGFVFPVLATAIRLANLGLSPNAQSILFVQSTDPLLWIIDTAPFFLGIFAFIAGRRQDKLQKAYSELRLREDELMAIQATLEQRVEERARELSLAGQKMGKRAGQLQTIAEVARAFVSIRDIDTLLPMLARLISERFGFYHVGIFLLDDSKRYAVLRASNSPGGQRMLRRRHKLKVGEQGVVGFVAHTKHPRIALDVGADAVFFNNPDLPQTRSEMALPLLSGDEIIGVLDIQSTEKAAFTDEDVEVLSILADQTAIAIQNALLNEKTQKALREAEIAFSQLTGSAWQAYAKTIRLRGYRYDGIKSEALKEAPASREEEEALSIPVRLRGKTIGRLKLKALDASREWTEDELAMMEAAAERAALAVEGARLLDDAQKRAAREAFLSEVAAKLGATFQLDSIMRDTVEELGQVLKNATISFQLVNPAMNDSLSRDRSQT
ncbi:MAG TPA: GAF domain-containing protein [Anaerolineales bacterium]|nr:GAF domain-containing protein [Anaerolineales bacterium]